MVLVHPGKRHCLLVLNLVMEEAFLIRGLYSPTCRDRDESAILIPILSSTTANSMSAGRKVGIIGIAGEGAIETRGSFESSGFDSPTFGGKIMGTVACTNGTVWCSDAMDTEWG